MHPFVKFFFQDFPLNVGQRIRVYLPSSPNCQAVSICIIINALGLCCGPLFLTSKTWLNQIVEPYSGIWKDWVNS